jgi:hypothetical protein
LNIVHRSFNYYIAILSIITLIGILFVPAVFAGKIINYGSIQRTIKTIARVNSTPTPTVVTPITIPFTDLDSKWPNTILPNPTSNNGGISGSIAVPSPIVTPAMDPSYITKEEAIQIAIICVSNISFTSDPVATLTTKKITYDFRSNEYTMKKPVWTVSLSGVSTDPNAIGVKQWFNSRTGEIIDVPIHANRWVTIDAITGRVISIESCW